VELLGYAVETLRKDQEFILYRGHSKEAKAPSVLLLATVSLHPGLETLKKMEHEYSFTDELDSRWAVRPTALSHYNERSVLVFEDFGGEPLNRLIEGPMEVKQFLHVAVGLANALHHLHKRHLIHKDLKPSNILVESASCQVRLTGFGIASRLGRERQSPDPPEFIAGTLAYMAPEQTGRMNRSIDSRSDLYSLGIVLYEMLTGILPFAVSDPMEWVHCHIARQPAPPYERVRNVPSSVSAIVLKLLAKTPEERYQTAASAERDLRRCLTEWETRGYIDEFPIGERDIADRLLIPEKLYGRAPEVRTLLSAFDRVVDGGRPELVLVSGYSGIGKSSLVNELHKSLVPPCGLFASGKFDQHKRDAPYAVLAQAFQGLIHPLFGKNEAELTQWRDALHKALDQHGQLIVDLVPELKLIIGEQPPIPELSTHDAQRRFQIVFRRFIGVFARPEHPLALFFDDLQWLDAATLDLIEDLLIQTDVEHFMLIGAYRDNEVDPAHPLMRKLEAIRKGGTIVHDIVLAPLTREDLERLIADALHCEPDRASPLAQLIHDKTTGNPFFTIQFITSLAEEGLVAFDPGEGRWSWDVNSIRAKGYTDNVVHLMVEKLGRLPAETQNALKLLACLGNRTEFTTLHMVRQESEDIHAHLWEAVRAGLIFSSEDSYTFLHDRVQEAAYSLITEQLRAETHLRIGRLLAECTPSEKLEEGIFEIVNQLNRGSDLITSMAERERLAELNLVAARRAKLSTAYASALKYLTIGRELLTDGIWQRNYDLIFSIECLLAECELLTGNLLRAEDRLSELAQSAKSSHGMAVVTRLRLTVYTALDRSDRGVEVCLEYLRRDGGTWPLHPTIDEVRHEYDRVWALVGNREIEELIDLPLMTNPNVLDVLDVLTEVVTPAVFFDEKLSSFLLCRMISLSLEHGNTAAACFAYVWFAVIARSRFGNYKDAFRFGRLGYDLVECRGLTTYQARTYMSFGNLVIPSAKHVLEGRELVRRAFDAAYQNGDLTFAAYSLEQLIANFLAAGDLLAEVQREAEAGLAFAQKAGFGLVVDLFSAQLQLVRMLRGLTTKFGCFNDEHFNELEFERHLASNPVLADPEFGYWALKVQARFLAGDYDSAIHASIKAHQLLWSAPSLLEPSAFRFYSALSYTAAWDSSSADQRQRYFDAARDHYRQLEIWSENCPQNFENRAALVGAEIARIEGRLLDAEELYEKAIRSAHANGFMHNEAVANEVAARFYAARGFEKIARAYLRDARYCYERWGANGKIRQIDNFYPHLTKDEVTVGPRSIIGVPLEQLDLGTVIKVSQAVSAEMDLDKLIDTVMCAAIEHAGAARGLLILSPGNGQRIEAEATTLGDKVLVRRKEAALGALPQSIVNYVARTQEFVILDDASSQNRFAADTYFSQHHARSVLCLPLITQGKLVGVLYLENNLAPNVFTSNRVAVLKLLASQAAISLENTQLYSDLRRREAKIRRLVDANVLGITMWDAEGAILASNEAFLRLVQYDHEDVAAGRVRWTDMTPADWRERVERALAKVMQTGTVQPFESELFRKNGSRVPVLVAGALFEEGGHEGVAFVLDLSEQKRAEEALRRSESYLAEAQRLTHTGSCAIDGTSREIRYWSQEMFRLFGFDQQQGLPMWDQWVQRIHPDDRDRFGMAGERTFREKVDCDVEFRIVKPDGTVRDIHGIGHPVLSSNGELVQVVGTMVDITESRRAEEALRRSESYLAQAQRLAHIGSWAWEVPGLKASYLSEEWYRVYDFDPKDGMPTWEERLQRVHPEDRARYQATIDQAIAQKSGYDVEFRILPPRSPGRYIHSVGHPIFSPEGELQRFLGVAMDVTESKRAEEAFRLIVVGTAATTGSDFFQSLVQHMAQALRARYAFVTTCDDQKHARSLAFWKGDGFGENFEFDIADTPCERVLHGEVCHYPQGLQGLFPLDMLLADWQAESYLGLPMLDRSNRVIGHIAILDDKPMEADLRTIDLLKIFASRAAAELKRQKAEDELQAALRERERLRRAQADLAHINRVSTLGELTASLAHEIKQPIGAAVTNAEACLQLLEHDQPDLPEVREAVLEAVKDARRAADIIDRVRSLYQKGSSQLSSVDVNQVIREMALMLQNEADRHRVTIHTDLVEALPEVMADRVQLQQALMNLMLNGVEAMRDTGGELAIKSQLAEDGQLLISVIDTGAGLPTEDIDKIFDAFFTTKSQGTGLGLAITRSIVESHSGRIWATANPGRGAIFQFTLPGPLAAAA
jgi:PAS domain S-box-containing protein